MTPYIIQGGLIGFLLVLALNILNDNGIGISIVRSCIAALAFAFVARWFARMMFSELHLSVWSQQQQDAQQAAAAAIESEASESEGGEQTAAE
tara:strand:+ start:1275 stop:1553 length:279 start_codon:yes stop_codon:yes gene_type:complete